MQYYCKESVSMPKAGDASYPMVSGLCMSVFLKAASQEPLAPAGLSGLETLKECCCTHLSTGIKFI